MDMGIIIGLAAYFIWVVPLRIWWKKHDGWLWSGIGMVIAIAVYFIWVAILRIMFDIL